MITTAAKYEYNKYLERSQTQATLADGRVVMVDCRYNKVWTRVGHADTCACHSYQPCDCGLLADIDTKALVADARAHGIFEPSFIASVAVEDVPSKGVCPKCGTFCQGDCEAR